MPNTVNSSRSQSASSPPAAKRSRVGKSARPAAKAPAKKAAAKPTAKHPGKLVSKTLRKQGPRQMSFRLKGGKLQEVATSYLFGPDTPEVAQAKTQALALDSSIAPTFGEVADRLATMAQMLRKFERSAQRSNKLLRPEPSRRPAPRKSTGDLATAVREAKQNGLNNLIARGDFIPAAQLCDRLGISPQGLSKAKSAKRMFAVSGPAGKAYYPSFFADPRHDRRQLEKVSKALQDLPATSKYFFFTAPRQSLGGKSPLDAIANGQIEAVLRSANGFVER